MAAGSAASVAVVQGGILEILVRSNTGEYVKNMSAAQTATAKFSESLRFTGRMAAETVGYIEKVGRRTAYIGAGMAAGFIASAKVAAQFSSEMRNVNTITQLSEKNFGRMSDQVLNMSKRFPQSTSTLARGLYDIVSSGIQGADAIEVLAQASKAATAGLTSTGVAAHSITAIMNAYGLSAAQAADISDTLFQTVNLGVLTFEELASTTGEWVAMASTVGVSAAEAGAALATMTLSGIQANEAATSLARLLEEFIQPAEGMANALRVMGYESGTAFLEANGLRGALAKLSESTGGTAESFTTLFPNIRAARGAMALAANEGENYSRVAAEITDVNKRAGATQEAYQQQIKEFSLQMELLKNGIHALVVEIGQGLLPAAKILTTGFKQVLDILNAIPKPVKELAEGMLIATSVIALFGGALAGWGLKIMLFHRGMALLNTALIKFVPSAALAGTKAHAFSEAIKRAGSYTGPFTAGIHQVGASLHATRVGAIMPYIGALAGLSVALVAGVMAGKMFVNHLKDVQKQGREAARQFASGFSTQSLDDARLKVKGLRDELEKLTAKDQFKFWSWTKGGILDWFDEKKTEAQTEEIRRLAALAEKEIVMANERIATAILTNIAPTGLVPEAQRKSIDENIRALTVYQDVLGITADKTIEFYARMAAAQGIDFQIELDPWDPDTRDEYNKQAEAITKSLTDMVRVSNASSANLGNTEQAIVDLGNAFATAKTKVQGLKNAMDAFVTAALELEEGTDNVEGSLNEIYLHVQDIKEAGTLGQAMDLTSFHEDALTLRGDFRGLVKEVSDTSIAWAKDQKNLKGEDFLKYLKDRADYIRRAGKEMGLDAGFVEHYAKMIEDIGENRELAIQFNSNVASEGTKLQEYLKKLGMAQGNIETTIVLYRDKGEAALREWLSSVYQASDEEVNTVVNLINEDAKNRLETWQTQVKLSDQDVSTLVRLQFAGDQKALEAFLMEKGIQGPPYQAFVDIVGKDDATLALGLINSMLTDLGSAKITPKIDADTSEAMAKIAALQTALNNLVNRQNYIIGLGYDERQGMFYQQTPAQPSPPAAPAWPEPPTYGSVIPGLARGEVHTAQIGWDTRMWAEPETGGEAYIPLAPNKRGRSSGLLRQVASMFGYGLKKFQEGGFNFPGRFRPEEAEAAATGGATGPTTTALDYIRNQYTAKVIGMAELRAALMEELAGLEQFSNEWIAIWSEISRLDEDAADQVRENADKLKEQVEKEGRVWQFRYEEESVSGAEYLVWLRQQIAKEEQYSERWMDLKREIVDVEKAQIAELRRVRDVRFQAGDTPLSEYIATLRDDLASMEKYSEEWIAAKTKLDEVTNVAGFRTFAGFGQFTSADFVSEKQLLKYFERQASKAQRWSALVTELSGKVHPWVLDELIKGGPSSLPLAEAISRMVNNGNLGALNSYIGSIQGASDSFMRATTQPAMVSPAGNGMASMQVTFENVTVSSQVDLNRLLQELPMIINAKWGVG